MASMLERMRNKQKERKSRFQLDPAIFAPWNLKFGNAATIRHLCFEDEVSQGFWVEKIMMPMEFVDDQNDSNTIKFQAPSLHTYETGVKCPLKSIVSALFDEATELKESGNTRDAERVQKKASKHWIKGTYYYQGFVIKPGFDEETIPDNPIRILPYNKEIHSMLQNLTFSEDDPFPFLPTGEYTMDDIADIVAGNGDIEELVEKTMGFNFILKKMQKGDYPDWVKGSAFAKQPTPLTEEQIAALGEYGLHDIRKDKLPPKPTEEQYSVLVEMLETSIGGGTWNPEWEDAGFKPYRGKKSGKSGDGDDDGNSGGSRKSNALASRKSKPAEEDADDVNDSDDSGDDGDSAVSNKVLDRINSRKRKAAEDDSDADTPNDSGENSDDSGDDSDAGSDDDSGDDSGNTEEQAPVKGRGALAARLSQRYKKKD